MTATLHSLLAESGIIPAFRARVTADGGTIEAQACLAAELADIKSFYNRFSIIYPPNGFKANKIYALKPVNGDADLASVRATVATRRDSSGNISDVVTGMPRLNTRFGYTCPRQLIELNARTNLLLRSEEFDNASWTKTNCTVTADAVVGPDGTSIADAVFETVTVGQHRLEQAIVKAGSVLAYAFTFYVKPNGRDWIYVSIRNGGNTANRWYNITTGVRGSTTGSGVGFVHVNANILDAGNGWFKVEMNANSNTAGALTVIVASSTDNAVATDYAGDITKGFYIWGAQLEQAASGSSYIPTTTATATRNSETITTKTGLSSYIGATEGSIYFRGFVNFDGTDKRITITDGTANNRINLIFGTDNKARCYIQATTVQADFISPDVFRSDSELRVVLVYAANRAALFINGVKVGEDLTVTVPSGMDRIAFNDSGLNFSGAWKLLAISNIAFTDQQAETLSTPVEYPPIIKNIIPITLTGDPDYYAFGNGVDIDAFFPDYSIYIAKRGVNHVLGGGNTFGMLYNEKFNLYTAPFVVIDGGTTYYSGISAGIVGNQIFIQVARYTVSAGVDTFSDIGYLASVDLTTLTDAEELKLSSSWGTFTALPTPTYPRYESYGKLQPSAVTPGTYYVPWFEHNGTLHSLHVRKIVYNSVDNFTITDITVIAASTTLYYEPCLVNDGAGNWLFFASKGAGSFKLRLFSSTDDCATWSDVGDTVGVGTGRCIPDAVYYNGLVTLFYQDRSDGFIYESKNNTWAQCLALTMNTPVKYDYNGFGDSTNGLGYPSIWELRSGVFMKTWCKETDANQAHVYGTLSSI